MNTRQEIPSKLVSSTVNVTFNFTSDLAVGETITSASCACTTFSSVDASPSAIISGPASISGAVVTQKITGGLVGVMYELLCTANTSAGQTLKKSGFLAVVPDL